MSLFSLLCETELNGVQRLLMITHKKPVPSLQLSLTQETKEAGRSAMHWCCLVSSYRSEKLVASCAASLQPVNMLRAVHSDAEVVQSR